MCFKVQDFSFRIGLVVYAVVAFCIVGELVCVCFWDCCMMGGLCTLLCQCKVPQGLRENIISHYLYLNFNRQSLRT